jgi:hypothetical protein
MLERKAVARLLRTAGGGEGSRSSGGFLSVGGEVLIFSVGLPLHPGFFKAGAGSRARMPTGIPKRREPPELFAMFPLWDDMVFSSPRKETKTDWN